VIFSTPTGATFSGCGTYRYLLWRRWASGPLMNALMLNPSTADFVRNDPTVERCERRAREYGFGGLIVTNLFALRSTDPAALIPAADPVGGWNDDAIRIAAARSGMVLCGWGNDGRLRGRSARVRELLAGRELHALKLTAKGEPWHPLYVSYRIRPAKLWA
jgi:hypothetical protein